jgi:hypothetical protein
VDLERGEERGDMWMWRWRILGYERCFWESKEESSQSNLKRVRVKVRVRVKG